MKHDCETEFDPNCKQCFMDIHNEKDDLHEYQRRRILAKKLQAKGIIGNK